MSEKKENKNSSVKLSEELRKELKVEVNARFAMGLPEPTFGELLLEAWGCYKAAHETGTPMQPKGPELIRNEHGHNRDLNNKLVAALEQIVGLANEAVDEARRKGASDVDAGNSNREGQKDLERARKLEHAGQKHPGGRKNPKPDENPKSPAGGGNLKVKG